MKKCKDCIHDCVCTQMWRIAEGCSYYEESRPHGEWKQVGEMTYKCTKCGWLKKIGLMPYCENCGADMRKEVKRNDG